MVRSQILGIRMETSWGPLYQPIAMPQDPNLSPVLTPHFRVHVLSHTSRLHCDITSHEQVPGQLIFSPLKSVPQPHFPSLGTTLSFPLSHGFEILMPAQKSAFFLYPLYALCLAEANTWPF